MLSTVLGYIGGLVGAVLSAMGGIIVTWPVAIMAAFLILGVGTGAIKKLVNARKGRKRRA